MSQPPRHASTSKIESFVIEVRKSVRLYGYPEQPDNYTKISKTFENHNKSSNYVNFIFF